MRIPPLRIKSLLESNPLKPELLVGGLGVRDAYSHFLILRRGIPRSTGGFPRNLESAILGLRILSLRIGRMSGMFVVTARG